MAQSKLVRSDTDKMVAGVCGGLAAYLDIDPVLVRLAFVVLFFASGIGFPIYLILWIVMPRAATASESDAVVIQDNQQRWESFLYYWDCTSCWSSSVGPVG